MKVGDLNALVQLHVETHRWEEVSVPLISVLKTRNLLLTVTGCNKKGRQMSGSLSTAVRERQRSFCRRIQSIPVNRVCQRVAGGGVVF